MKSLVLRILFFSDAHVSVNSNVDEEKWFPPLCNILSWISPKLTNKFLKFWDNFTQKYFSKMLQAASEEGPYDLIIGLGDYTPGTNESGIITLAAEDQYKIFQETFDIFFENVPRIFVLGNCDTGFNFDVSGNIGFKIGTEEGGMSEHSVNAAIELIGLPFGSKDMGPVRFIWISTDLVRNVDSKSPMFLQRMKEAQERFLRESINSSEQEHTFLLLHDPTAIHLSRAISLTLFRSRGKISAIMHGHLHARFSAFFTKMFYKPYGNLCKHFVVKVVPASWGWLGMGKGFCVLKIFDDGTFEIKKHSIG